MLSDLIPAALRAKPIGIAGPSSPRVSGVSDEAVTPVPENVEGVNFDYRGQEQHGVPVSNGSTHPQDPRRAFMHTANVEHVEHPHPPTPVLVKVVKEDGTEKRSFRIISTAANGTPSMILNRMRDRTRVLIFNNGGDMLWIGTDSTVSAFNGYPVPANGGTLELLNNEEPIWAMTGFGNVDDVRILVEFSKG